MLLARVAAELRTNPEYTGKLLPVRFMEESHEIRHIGDFWLDTLYYLAKECASCAPELARELEGVHTSLAGEWRDPRLHYRARAAVLNAADRLGRQLVLMVENLQTLCEDVDDGFDWELRESLQMEPKIMLLGTATSRFSALDDAREAFFELFRITTLGPLDTDDCRRLWEAVTGNQVERNNMRPLEILTGGSPRLLVIVADFARHSSFHQLLEELITLVDDHTDYFRGQLEALPKTERRVYLAMLSLWRPSSTSEIAARARMGVRITSSMLGRLVDRGALTVEGGVRKRRYAPTERLYCIYYKIRRERDKAAVVQNLIRFMTLYYVGRRTASDLRHALADEVAHNRDVLAGMVRALREDASVGLFAPEAAIFAYNTVIEEHAEDPSLTGRGVRASGMAAKAMTLFGDERYREAREVHNEVVKEFGTSDEPDIQMFVAQSWFNLGLARQRRGELEAAVDAYDEVVRYKSVVSLPVQDIVAHARSNKAFVLGDQGKVDEALEIYDGIACYVRDGRAQELQRHRARALVNVGIMRAKLGQWAAAASAWKGMVREFGDHDEAAIRQEVARALYKLSAVELLTGSAESAIRGSEQVIDRYGTESDIEMRRTVARCLDIRGGALEQLDRLSEALETYRELQDRFGDLDDSGVSVKRNAISARTRIRYRRGDIDAARQSLRSLYRVTDVESDQNVIDMYREIVTFTAAHVDSPDHLADVLSSDVAKSGMFRPLEIALRRLAGQDVRAPIEVMEVADDILEEIENLRDALGDMAKGQAEPASLKRSLAHDLPRLATRARRLAGQPSTP